MTPPSAAVDPALAARPPDHTELPCEDGRVHNFHEHPQSELLTACLLPRLNELHPDGQFCIGQDCGIYWKVTQPPLDGCKAPDWFYVPNVPPMLDGQVRRSYVRWYEGARPLVVIEYVSGDGEGERDRTPQKGKFWVYEQAIGAAFYVIFEPWRPEGVIELYKLEADRYQPVEANAAGRYPIGPLGVELGTWAAPFRGLEMPWLRAWDSATGRMLPHPSELAESERQRADAAEALVDDFRREAEHESERAESERKRADDAVRQAEKLAARLRALGLDPDAA